MEKMMLRELAKEMEKNLDDFGTGLTKWNNTFTLQIPKPPNYYGKASRNPNQRTLIKTLYNSWCGAHLAV